MKNKKGFTLVELIAVILILGIIAVIGVVSVNSISKSIKKRQYDNLIQMIKVAAKNYQKDNGAQKVYVQTLIDQGYITADDDKGNLNNPNGTEDIRCYIIDMSGKDAKIDDKNKTCSTAPIYNANIDICLYKGDECEYISSNKWLNKDYAKDNKIVLGYRPNPSYKNLNEADIDKVEWATLLAPDVIKNGKKYTVDASKLGYIDSEYTVKIRFKDTAILDDKISNKNRYYTASKHIKVDTSIPKVSYTSSDLSNWAKVNNIPFVFEDVGSGLKKYTIISLDDNTATSYAISGNEVKKTLSFNKNGKYQVYAEDKSGNLSTAKQLSITKIDNVEPSCSVSSGYTTWTNKAPRYITYGCVDNESGCKTATKAKQFNTSAKTAYLEKFTIEDNAGNRKECSERYVNVYLDLDKPKVNSFTITSKNIYYNAPNVSISITAEDQSNLSGLSQICITTSNNADTCNWKPYSGGTYQDVYNFEGNIGDGASYTLYAFVKDKAGNISDSYSSSYRLYSYCDRTISFPTNNPCYEGWYSTYFYDEYSYNQLNQFHYCGENQQYYYQDYNTCCSNATFKSTPVCTSNCGDGHYLYFYGMYSNYDENYFCADLGYYEDFASSCYDMSGCTYPPYQPPDVWIDVDCNYECAINSIIGQSACDCNDTEIVPDEEEWEIVEDEIMDSYTAIDCGLRATCYGNDYLGFRAIDRKLKYYHSSCQITNIN